MSDATRLVTIAVFALCFASAILLGMSSAIAVPGILAAMLLSFFAVMANGRVLTITFLALALYLYAVLNGMIFGGLASLTTSGIPAWLGGEGRFFLYFWPFIFLTLMMRHGAFSIAFSMERVLMALTFVAFLGILAWHAGANVYSSHHAAGAVLGALTIFNYHRYKTRGGAIALLLLLVAVAGLLGTNSRTSLLAAILGIFAPNLLLLRVGQLVKIAVVVPVLAVVMANVFPDQYARLASTAEVNPATVVARNFEIAWYAEPPLESASAWSLSTLADKSGQANLAIRGLLWARGVSEGAKSPIVGAGFGRYNDTGREFVHPFPLVKVAVDARYKNPSVHSSHNTFIMIFAELGLIGLGLALGVLWVAARTCFAVLLRPNIAPEGVMWANIGFGCLITILFAGLTQHSIGAPIYGLTLLQLVAIAYCCSREALRQ